MLLLLYIVFEILLFVLFAVAFKMKDFFFWGMVVVLAGIMALSSTQIAETYSTVDQSNTTLVGSTYQSDYNTIVLTKYTTDIPLMLMNFFIAMLGIMMFFTTFLNWKNGE